jgi:asparagine synthase (glutamine-hydrolysing)
MCGIAGKLLFDRDARVDPGTLAAMAGAIAHRGPDDEGTWTDGAIGLASRRLAVIDLSPRGHMPMASLDGTRHIVYNGEIYNFQALRASLERDGHRFRSDSDTEVILELYARDGIDAIAQLRGMFALALWDAPRRRLVLARDRLGKKPLFYCRTERMVVFGSEPKALLQDPEVPSEADPEALALFLGLGYVPGPWSAFRGLRKLPPAHVAVIEDGTLTERQYWTLQYRPKRRESEEVLVEELRARLREAVRLRLISDVPVGALLSGGVDSSAVVATMCQEFSGQVKTFCIGFDEARYDERAHAEAVARHLGTAHRTLVVRPDAAAVLDRLVWHYNEPFADSSAVPSMAVSELARSEVTVALNGDGGDEAFIGYERYLALAAASRLDRLPAGVRRGLAAAGEWLPTGQPKSFSHRLRRFLDALPRTPAGRWSQWTGVFDREARAGLMTTAFAAAAGAGDAETLVARLFAASGTDDLVETAVRADVMLYLPDDLLVKMDIASMAHSLEVRSPLLDQEIVEFAASLPVEFKLRGRTLKYLLKRAMEGVLPPQILTRGKMGFGVPIDRWFRHELRELAYDTLLDSRAASRGLLRPEAVRRYLDEHVAGRAHHHHRLWALLMLELWHRTFIDRRCPAAPPSLARAFEGRPPAEAAEPVSR